MSVPACRGLFQHRSASLRHAGGKQAATITAYHGHTSTIFAVAWSPDGTRIASGGNDNTIQVWNATSGQTLMSYPVPSSAIDTDGTLSVAWLPDGARIASGGAETIVHLWKAPALCRR